VVQQYHTKYSVSATAYLTGVPLSIATQMLAGGEITERGVLPPEKALPTNQFVAELAKRDIEVQEKFETIKTIRR